MDDVTKPLLEGVNEVQDELKITLEKAKERDDILTDVLTKVERMEEGAKNFKDGAKKLKNKHYWESKKMQIVIAAVAIIITVIIVAISISHTV